MIVLGQGEGSTMRRCYFDPFHGQHKGGNDLPHVTLVKMPDTHL